MCRWAYNMYYIYILRAACHIIMYIVYRPLSPPHLPRWIWQCLPRRVQRWIDTVGKTDGLSDSVHRHCSGACETGQRDSPCTEDGHREAYPTGQAEEEGEREERILHLPGFHTYTHMHTSLDINYMYVYCYSMVQGSTLHSMHNIIHTHVGVHIRIHCISQMYIVHKHNIHA